MESKNSSPNNLDFFENDDFDPFAGMGIDDEEEDKKLMTKKKKFVQASELNLINKKPPTISTKNESFVKNLSNNEKNVENNVNELSPKKTKAFNPYCKSRPPPPLPSENDDHEQILNTPPSESFPPSSASEKLETPPIKSMKKKLLKSKKKKLMRSGSASAKSSKNGSRGGFGRTDSSRSFDEEIDALEKAVVKDSDELHFQKRMLIEFKIERERKVIWDTVSLDALPIDYQFAPGDVVWLADGVTSATVLERLAQDQNYRVEIKDTEEIKIVPAEDLSHCVKILVNCPTEEQISFFETFQQNCSGHHLTGYSTSLPLGEIQ